MDEDKDWISVNVKELRLLFIGIAIASSVSTLLGVGLVWWVSSSA